jgi:hypothetical protein
LRCRKYGYVFWCENAGNAKIYEAFWTTTTSRTVYRVKREQYILPSIIKVLEPITNQSIILRLPRQIPLTTAPFTPVEPGYGVGLFEDDYLFLLPAVDLRMDPALRPRPVSLVAFAYLGNTPQLDYSIEQWYI